MADHEDYLPGETPAAHKTTHQDEGTDEISVAGLSGVTEELAAHALVATAHQNAPGLIETHRLVPGAHHAKYTDGEARASMSPLSIPPSALMPLSDMYDWRQDEKQFYSRSALTAQYYYAPVILPHGCTVTKFTLYGYRDDALSAMTTYLYRADHENNRSIMASCNALWVDGYNLIYDSSINNPVIDNENYMYVLRIVLNPNNAVGDIKVTGFKINFTG